MGFTDGLQAIRLVAERKIQEALAEGQFDNLPGRGRPQKLDELDNLPEDLRMAYTILKNSGHLEESRDSLMPLNMHQLLSRSSGEGSDCGKLDRLQYLLSRNRKSKSAREAEPDPLWTDLDPGYVAKILKK